MIQADLPQESHNLTISGQYWSPNRPKAKPPGCHAAAAFGPKSATSHCHKQLQAEPPWQPRLLLKRKILLAAAHAPQPQEAGAPPRPQRHGPSYLSLKNKTSMQRNTSCSASSQRRRVAEGANKVTADRTHDYRATTVGSPRVGVEQQPAGTATAC